METAVPFLPGTAVCSCSVPHERGPCAASIPRLAGLGLECQLYRRDTIGRQSM